MSAATAAGFSIDSATGLISAEPPADEDHLRWETDPAFPEVPAKYLAGDRWKLVMADRWLFQDNILLLEARAVIKAAMRIAHSSFGRDGHALILVDNMSVVLALTRFRAKEFRLLVLMRRLAAIALSRYMQFHLRLDSIRV